MAKKKSTELSELRPGDAVFASVRDSGGRRQALSVGQQRAEIERYAAEHGLVVIRWFVDEATPAGDYANRDEFQALVDECLRKPPPVRGVLVWNLARWSRGQDEVSDDALLYKIMLRRNGVNVVSVSENIPEGYLGGIVEKLIESSNYLENRRKAQDVRRAQASLTEQGFPTGGRPPLGYLSERVEIPGAQGREARLHCRWKPDPAGRAAIVRAFEMRAGGYSIKQINAELHLYPTKSGYSQMFVNPVYRGALRYGDLEYAGRVEALVTADLWQRAQVNGLRRGRVAGNYLLSGLLRCGRCGKALTGKHVSSTVKGKLYDYTYYQCARQDRTWGAECNAGMIPTAELDALVLDDLRTQLLNVDVIMAAVDVLRRLEAEQGMPDVDRLQGKAEHLRRQLARQQQLAADPDFDVEVARQRTRELRAELGLVDGQLGARRGVQLAGFNADYVRAWVLRMTDVLEGADMPERKRLLRRLIAEIRVSWPDDITVNFRQLDEMLSDE
jgi:site-specific DNA recombinase